MSDLDLRHDGGTPLPDDEPDQLSRDLEAALADAHYQEALRLGAMYPAAMSPALFQPYAAAILPVVLAAIDQAVTNERERIKRIIEAVPVDGFIQTPNRQPPIPIEYSADGFKLEVLALLNNEEPG